MSLNNISWHCCNCGMPIFSTSLFESFIADTNNVYNSFSVLEDSASTSSTSPGPPLLTSSPSTMPTSKTTSHTGNLRVLNINFQSIKNKKEELCNIIDSSDPSVIIGTETWLNPNIHSHEIPPPPPNYEVLRKDRKDGYGGVLLAVKKDFIIDNITYPPEYDCEAVFAKLSFGQSKSLIIGAAYRPPNNDVDYIERLCCAFENVACANKGAVIWYGGDFNLPDIQWSSMSVEGNQNLQLLNNRFIEMVQNCALEQMVTFPTRIEHTLDLFLTNRPSLVNRCTVIPGIADHDIVFVESPIYASRNKPTKRKVHLWKRADTIQMRDELCSFANNFITTYDVTSNIEEMSRNITSSLSHILDKCVPSKMTTTRFNQPWITREVKRLSRQKKRCFKKARDSKSSKEQRRYQHLKKATRSACKRAYDDYITNIISPDCQSNPKKFWSFITSKRTESTGVAPLKASDGLTYSDPTTKANILNDQFSSVFNSTEDPTTIKELTSPPHTSMPKIDVDVNGVQKLLAGLNIHKAAGPDGICKM